MIARVVGEYRSSSSPDARKPCHGSQCRYRSRATKHLVLLSARYAPALPPSFRDLSTETTEKARRDELSSSMNSDGENEGAHLSFCKVYCIEGPRE